MKIALCGKMRGGKDTIAEYAFLKYGFSRFAFGDGIREVCRLLFPEQMKNGKVLDK
jgi:dephospho-CoA kinase